MVLLAAGAVVVAVRSGGPSGPVPDERGARELGQTTPRPAAEEPPSGPDAGGIRGTVRRRGVPCAARIEVRRAPDDLDLPADDPFAVATAGDDGRYRTGSLPAGWVEVLAIAAGGDRVRRRTEIPADGAPVGVDLGLPGGPHGLRGRVRWADGSPFRGIVRLGGQDAPTDDGGRFELEGLEAGEPDIVFLRPGETRIEGPNVEIPAGREVDLVVDQGWRDVRVRVLRGASEEPVPGAVVVVRTHGSLLRQSLVADGSGAIRLRLPTRVVTLCARMAGLRSQDFVWAGSEGPVDLRLLATGRIAGRVVAARDGRPLPGIIVEAEAEDVRATSDEGGRYRLEGLRPGEIGVAAHGPSHVTPEEGQERDLVPRFAITVRAGETSVCDLRVVPTFRVRGRVLGPDGPLVAVVSAPTAYGMWARARAPSPVVSGPDGRFEITGLHPEEAYRLVAHAPGLLDARSGVLVGRSGETVDVDLRLEAGAWIDVTAVGADGTPAQGANVWSWGTSGIADSSGTARLGPIAVGIVEVCARRHDLGIASVRLSATDRPDTLLLLLEPEPREAPSREDGPSGPVGWVPAGTGPTGPVTLRIECVGPDGEPVPRADVVAHGDAGPGFYRGGGRGTVASGVAELHGERAAAPVLIEVSAARDAAGERIPLGTALVGPVPFGAGRVVVRLPPAQAIAGVVLDPQGGPGSGVRVTACRVLDDGSHGAGGSTRTDPGGRFRIEGLGPGAYRLTASGTSSWREPEPVTARAGDVDVTLLLCRGHDAIFTVLGPADEPVAGAMVDLSPHEVGSTSSDFVIPAWTRTAVSDAAGRVRFDGLDPEQPYDVMVATVEPFGTVYQVWTPGDDSTLRLTRRDLFVEGSVIDGAGNPLGNVRLARIRSRGGTTVLSREVTCRDGTFRVGPLEPGEIGLVAFRPGDDWEDDLWPRWKGEAGASGVALVYEPGWELEVRVSGWPTGKCGHAWLSRGRHATVTPDGTARFSGLVRGRRYELWVKPTDHDGYAVRKNIGEQTTDLAVFLEEGKTIHGRVTLGDDVRSVEVSVAFGPGRIERTFAESASFEIRGVPPQVEEIWVDVMRARLSTSGAWRIDADGRVDVDTRR